MAGITLRGITKAFGSTQVLKGVDLAIADGEFISLVGPSGCGKSTLLRIIAGLEQQTSGSVQIAGASVDRVAPSERNLAMVFQSYALYPHLSVFDNIAVPLRMRRLNVWQRLALVRRAWPEAQRVEQRIRGEVERVAQMLDIVPLLGRKPAQLSGGQRQRVAVGRAIVREPSAFLLDEPLSNLDAKLRVHMRAELAQLHRRLGTTFVYVTHDQAEAMTMSDRIVVMMDGELVQVGSPDEVYDNPNDLRVAEFIGSPKLNTLPGQVVSGGFGCGGVYVPLVIEAAAGVRGTLGIRPEALRIGADGDVVLRGCTVTHIENLGAELYVHCEVPDAAAVIARVAHVGGAGVRLGMTLDLAFDTRDVRLFDSRGRRLAATVIGTVRSPEAIAA